MKNSFVHECGHAKLVKNCWHKLQA